MKISQVRVVHSYKHEEKDHPGSKMVINKSITWNNFEPSPVMFVERPTLKSTVFEKFTKNVVLIFFFKTWFRRCCWPQIWKGKLRQYFTKLDLNCEVPIYFSILGSFCTWYIKVFEKLTKIVVFEFRHKNSNYVFSNCVFSFFKAKINFEKSIFKVLLHINDLFCWV